VARHEKAVGRTTHRRGWVTGREAGPPEPGETAQQYATRILNDKYGAGNWRKGGGSEFSQIVKWVTRGGRLS
jgi:hypothetical protein